MIRIMHKLVSAVLLAGAAAWPLLSPAATLTVQSMPPGAKINVDGRELQATTPVMIEVQPGRHVIRLEKQGCQPVSRMVEAYSGKAFASFNLSPKKEPSAAPRLSAGKESSRDKDKSRNAEVRPQRRKSDSVTYKNKERPPSNEPVKFSYRNSDRKDPGTPGNILPEENPFSNWMDSDERKRAQKSPQAKSPGIEKKARTKSAGKSEERDEAKERGPIEIAHLETREKRVFPLVHREPAGEEKKSREKLDAKPAGKEGENSNAPTPAKAEKRSRKEKETKPGPRSLKEFAEKTPAPKIPAPRVDWPKPAETMLAEAAAKLPSFPEKLNILLLGLDRRDREGIFADGPVIPLPRLKKIPALSDVIMVVQLDFIDNQVRVVSVPRDTRAYIPGRGYRKINSAYALGKEKLAKRVVERFLKINIHRTMVADYRGAKKCISIFKKLGMGYRGYSEKELFWHLRKRSFPRGDLTRIERQQRFIKHAMTEYMRFTNDSLAAKGAVAVVKRSLLDMAVKQALKVVDTDLTPQEIKLMTYAFRDYDPESMTMAYVRGRGAHVAAGEDDPGVYYIKPFARHTFDRIVARAESSP